MERKKITEICSTEILHNSGLKILAGRPASGKTAYALKLAKECAIDAQTPTAYFSMEMTSGQLMKRFVENTSEGYDANLYIDDSPSITVNELCSKCRQMVDEQGVKMVIIDYLQLMCKEENHKRKEEMSAILKSLYTLAKEVSISILALCQRPCEQDGDMMSSLRGDFDIHTLEQYVDTIIFLGYNDIK